MFRPRLILTRARALLPLLAFVASVFAADSSPPAGNEEVRKIMETFAGRGVQRDNTKPLPPDEALKRFTMREGFAIDLIASEPAVTQPLYLSFDSRGRLWVTQYIQYQYPAGLKVT